MNSSTKYIDQELGDRPGEDSQFHQIKTSDRTSIHLLKDIERRVFFLLDLIDCLPKEPVKQKLAEIERRKKIQESRKSYADQEVHRLEKLEKLKQKSQIPIPKRTGKPLVPMTLLKTQEEKREEIEKRKRIEFEKLYFDTEDDTSTRDYF